MTAFAQLRSRNLRGDATPLTEPDLVKIGALVDVGARELHAVIDVESSGRGFYADGRLKLLFEPHVFYRRLSGEKRDRAVAAGLAYPKWGTKPYPRDSYPRLVQAMAIDETAALLACSYGMTQIMGENHAACGFLTPQDMVVAFCSGEAAQMAATVALIRSMGLAGALKARDWARVAKGWNGAAYAKHGYDRKLKAAYARWGKAEKAVGPSAASAVATARVPPVRASVARKAPAGLPAVAPIGLGQLRKT